MVEIATSVFIARSPEQVRVTFLDFPSWPTWHKGFFKSITPLNPPPNTPSTTSPLTNPQLYDVGQKLILVLEQFTVQPTVTSNSPSSYAWVGEGYGLKGEHYFNFVPETRDGVNGCKFEHGERFGGLTSFMMGEGWVAGLLGIRKMSEKGFAAFNADLKRKCEGEGESAKRAGELGMKEVYEM